MVGVQTMVSLFMFNSHDQKKVSDVCTELVISFNNNRYTLNHLNICIRYSTLLKVTDEISKRNKVPIVEYLSSGVSFKFVGDNLQSRVDSTG